ncbi:MAG TPA: hypothetical protein VMC05_10890 [Xanthobacteraceae bacterium]|nr:hypothetical protein [Xanthobacteraceae bacterium]
MSRLIALALGSFAMLSAAALAQTAAPNNQAAPPAAAPTAAEAQESMDPPMVGDHWTYEVRDEITGELKNTLSNIVTDVTPTEIAVRVQNQAYSQGPSVLVYDRSWNVKNNPSWRYSPNDGTGIKMPLAVGNSWRFHDDQIRSGYGTTFKNVGTSKVVGTESVTTDAGTFQALKIQTSINGHNSNDSTKRFESTVTTWYVPSLDHWAKRTVKSAFNGSVAENDSLELVDYGRR